MDARTFDLAAFIAVRATLGYLYLYALYMNTHDTAARKWLVDHTAYLFPKVPEPTRSQISKLFALAGMLMMFVGGVLIVLGVEARIGAFLLLIFTAGGIYQHKREREVAMEVAQRIAPTISPDSKTDFETLQWSAYSGHFSSMLKNWALCGICAAIVVWGAGPKTITICDHLEKWFK